MNIDTLAPYFENKLKLKGSGYFWVHFFRSGLIRLCWILGRTSGLVIGLARLELPTGARQKIPPTGFQFIKKNKGGTIGAQQALYVKEPTRGFSNKQHIAFFTFNI